jgi:DHA2 family multidrug resistance protein
LHPKSSIAIAAAGTTARLAVLNALTRTRNSESGSFRRFGPSRTSSVTERELGIPQFDTNRTISGHNDGARSPFLSTELVQNQPAVRSSNRPAVHATAEESNFQYRWIILIGLILTVILQVLDATIVNVALPQMAGNLGATSDQIGWVSTGYILSAVVVLPMTAWLSVQFGRKRYLTTSIFIFILASFLCGTSTSLTEIVAWRVLQGIGGAALLSTAQATLLQVFPKKQHPLVLGIFSLGIVVAPTVAPALGGWLTDNYSWEWVFFINLPIGALAMFLVVTFLHDTHTEPNRNSVDWLGIATLAVGLGSLQYVLEEGVRYNWFDDPTITRLSILAAVSLISFVFWELSPRNAGPVVNIRVLRDRNLLVGASLSSVVGFGLLGALFIFPLFVQGVLRYTPTESGLLLLPGGLGTALAVIICSRILGGKSRRIDPRFLMMFGMIGVVIGNWLLGHVTTDSGPESVQIGLVIRGFGLGFVFIPIQILAFSTLRGVQIAQGTAMNNLFQQLGGSFGIAALNTYVTNMMQFHRSDLIANTAITNPLFLQRVAMIAGALHARGYGLSDAKAGALAAVNMTVQAQSATLAYDDAFIVVAVVFVVVLPLLVFFRPSKAQVKPTAVEI